LVIVLSVLFYFSFWPLCCLFFSTFSFGHCVVCSFLLFLLVIVNQKEKKKRTDNTMTKRKSRKEQTTQ
jgi:hypothetical protein